MSRARRHSRGNGIQVKMSKQPAVYILASKRNGTLYTGVTSNLQKRAWQHKNDLTARFHKTICSSPSRLLRATRQYDVRDNKGETDEEVEPGVEAGADRGTKS